MNPNRFKEYNKTGFPICPQCGEDELVSEVCLATPEPEWPPKIEDVLMGSFFCMFCNYGESKL